MKKIAVMLLAALMLFAFVACDNSTKVASEGENLKALFTTYADNVKVNEDGTGVVLVRTDVQVSETEQGKTGPSSWLGEIDKLTDFAGSPVEVAFSLDLSSMVENDYTVFSLGYGSNSEGESGYIFNYVTETIFTVLKTENGYKIAQVNNVSYNDDETNRTYVHSSESTKTIEDEDGVIDFAYTASFTAGQLETSLTANNEKAFDFTINGDPSAVAEIKGIGYFWNCASNIDTVELLNLEVK